MCRSCYEDKASCGYKFRGAPPRFSEEAKRGPGSRGGPGSHGGTSKNTLYKMRKAGKIPSTGTSTIAEPGDGYEQAPSIGRMRREDGNTDDFVIDPRYAPPNAPAPDVPERVFGWDTLRQVWVTRVEPGAQLLQGHIGQNTYGEWALEPEHRGSGGDMRTAPGPSGGSGYGGGSGSKSRPRKPDDKEKQVGKGSNRPWE